MLLLPRERPGPDSFRVRPWPLDGVSRARPQPGTGRTRRVRRPVRGSSVQAAVQLFAPPSSRLSPSALAICYTTSTRFATCPPVREVVAEAAGFHSGPHQGGVVEPLSGPAAAQDPVAAYVASGAATDPALCAAAILVLSDLVNSLLSLGLRPDRCSGDELRNAVSSLHVALANLGVGTPASVPSPSAEDPFALAVDWDGPAVVPRRLDEYPLFGLEFSEGHLPVVSPRGVAMLHCSFLCGPCAAAHALGSFNPSCYIHVLATMLCGVRCTWGPAGPPACGPRAPPLRSGSYLLGRRSLAGSRTRPHGG